MQSLQFFFDKPRYCKGASEIILEACTTILNKDGASDLKDKRKEEISNLIEEYASSGIQPPVNLTFHSDLPIFCSSSPSLLSSNHLSSSSVEHTTNLSSGLRTIGLAYKEFTQEPDWEDDDAVIKDLCFLGLAGIKVYKKKGENSTETKQQRGKKETERVRNQFD